MGQHEAVASLLQGGQDVGGDLPVPGLVRSEIAVDGGDAARCCGVSFAAVAESCRMDVQDWLGRRACLRAQRQGARWRLGHGVTDRAQLQCDQVIELVAAVGGRSQAQPAARRDLLHRMLERGRWDMVTFIDYHQPVAARKRSDVIGTRKGLQGGDIDDAASLGAATASLSRFDAEQLMDPGTPLVGESLAVDQDESGDGVGGDKGASDHGLTGAGWRDQHSEVVAGHGVVGGLLLWVERALEAEFLRCTWLALIGRLESAARLDDQNGQLAEEPAGQDQVAGRVFRRSCAGTGGCPRSRPAGAAVRRTAGWASRPRA